jgi:hypothetical protein
MNSKEYMADPNVASFTDWFARKLGERAIRHQYVDRETGNRVVFHGLCDALAQYSWNQRLYDQNAVDLDELRLGLRKAMKIQDSNRRDEAVRTWCNRVLRWGGVIPHNSQWLADNRVGLAKTIACVCEFLRSGNDVDGFPEGTRFNAGMTKIYSLLVSDFIIYDSRVAAALGWFVVEWCGEIKASALAELLAFSWMPAKEAPSRRDPKTRNPSRGPYRFARVNNSSVVHVLWNVRASWILTEVLRKSEKLCFHGKANPLRALEAALFMWGYDLGHGNNPAVTAD